MNLLRRIYRRLFPRPPVEFTANLKSYSSYEIGEWTYGRPTIIEFGEGATLHIGRFCSIAAGVKIFLGGEHRVDWVTTYPFNVMLRQEKQFPGHPHTKGNVFIGNDVWIGNDVLILSGVTIGDGAVVGAGSVVTKNVPAYSIVAGNPARLIRSRFPEDVVRDLENIAWWTWDMSDIKSALPWLLSDDIHAFIARYKKADDPAQTGCRTAPGLESSSIDQDREGTV